MGLHVFITWGGPMDAWGESADLGLGPEVDS